MNVDSLLRDKISTLNMWVVTGGNVLTSHIHWQATGKIEHFYLFVVLKTGRRSTDFQHVLK